MTIVLEKKSIILQTATEIDIVRIYKLFERHIREKSPDAVNAVGFKKHAFYILLDMICAGYCYKAEMGDRLIAVVSYCLTPHVDKQNKQILKEQFSYVLPSYNGFPVVDKLVEKAHSDAEKYNMRLVG